jgi:hypothetical protein
VDEEHHGRDQRNPHRSVDRTRVPLLRCFTRHPGAGQNVISAANGFLTVDYYVRSGGDGTCTLP